MNKTIEERAKELLDSFVGESKGTLSLDNYTCVGIPYGKALQAVGKAIAGATEAQDDWKRVEDGLRNMDRDKLITVFKAVSLIDIGECTFEYDIDSDGKHWCNAWRNGVVVDAIIFDGNLFHMMNRNDTFNLLNPMYEAYKALCLPSPPSNDKTQSA